MSELEKITTPVGELSYVHISGQGKRNYNDDGYVYQATIVMDKSKAEDLIEKIEVCLGNVQANETVKSKGYKELRQDEDGVYAPNTKTSERDKKSKPTGKVAFQFSTKTSFGDGKSKEIGVYNSIGKRVELGGRKIGNGTQGAISGSIQRYSAGNKNDKSVGVSLYLNNIQIFKFVEYKDDGGFESQEGGFVDFDEKHDDMPTDETVVESNEAMSKPVL
ncbi:MAG: hypothetical protein COV55_02785 [Candidatus Komeilibacteria bacterium CG11_big_fil_rev_8_21_14_0_20_36_20]|uniref:Single-stranded DNA-binding protein n=1 Tax=Candidatus Komeilibacteria bacterium CG11_big_fil_rev_8_21_14_0_20_36_20 TaxID=1974477 RepID=A0A2H0NCP3_9BACT|nr:MAG: hypothetical protein COV55_02785 [Candidatus Komeilibacteria bacterium CG11_big_fil_rev_8_21_14_0_20_36_20]